MPSAADEIAAAIDATPAHALRFDDFMHLALYGAHGFYTGPGGGRAGRRGGDFLTSPEVGPLFGAVLARALDGWWRELGEPDQFTFVDAGAGPGTLARAITAAAPQCAAALHYVAVEVSGAQRATHPPQVESTAVMPRGPFTGIVFANELLDNLPFRLLVADGGWREAHVTIADGRFVEVLRPLDARPSWLPASPPHGARVPWQSRAAEWIDDAVVRLDRGRVVAVDFVTPTTSALAVQPWREWLRTYRQHDRGGHYLASPGVQDLTTEVALDQLPQPDVVRTQSQFLQRWGIEELVAEGRREWSAQAARPSVAAIAMRSRVREADALLDPSGLGSFLVMEWCC